MKNYNFILCVLLIVILKAITSQSELVWRQSGNVETAKKCLFKRTKAIRTLKDVTSNANCEKKCLELNDCTHYTWSKADNLCSLRSGVISKNDALELDSPNFFCGLIIKSKEVSGHDFLWNLSDRVTWSENCDFFGNDINGFQISSSEDCGKKCNEHLRCTHFTWSNFYGGGTCWLKNGPISKNNAYASKIPLSVCGVVFPYQDV